MHIGTSRSNGFIPSGWRLQFRTGRVRQRAFGWLRDTIPLPLSLARGPVCYQPTQGIRGSSRYRAGGVRRLGLVRGVSNVPADGTGRPAVLHLYVPVAGLLAVPAASLEGHGG